MQHSPKTKTSMWFKLKTTDLRTEVNIIGTQKPYIPMYGFSVYRLFYNAHPFVEEAFPQAFKNV